MLNETGIQNEATSKIRSMIGIYEDYLLNKDTVYNSRSERDIKARDILRESTLAQLKSIAATNENAASVFATLFSNFLREG